MNFELFRQHLSALGIPLSERQMFLFKKYLTILNEWNQKIDLTALKSDEEIIEKHFFDSLLVSEDGFFHSQSLIDIGSGAGFPGIPLKIAFPDLEISLLEPTKKRCLFLNEVINQLGLDKITVINSRAEDISEQFRERFDVAIARAVAPLNILLELSLPLVKVGGIFIAMKGPNGKEELAQSEHALKVLFAHHDHTQEATLVSNADIRKNIFITKQKTTVKKYPRPFSEIKKNPL